MRKMNFLQRAAAGLKFAFSNGYFASRNTRNRGTRGNGSIRSEEIELSKYDRDRVISTLLEFSRNNPIVEGIKRLIKSDVVGNGIHPHPMTGSEELDNEIEAQWRKFAESPDITGQYNLVELQQMIAISPYIYGDCGLIVGPSKVQIIDGSRIGNPSSEYTSSEDDLWQNGVRVNRHGMPVSYSIGRRTNGQLQDFKTISENNFIHFFFRDFPTQYRGIPKLASVVNILQDLDEFDEIEMVAAKVAATLSVFIESEDPYNLALANQDEEDDEGSLEQLIAGRYQYGRIGEKPHVISPNGRPNVNAVEWARYLFRKIGSATGIPVEFLLQEIGGSSFSASQGVVLQYQSMIEANQNWMIKGMNRLYRRWLLQQVANGEIATGNAESMVSDTNSDLYRVRWQKPAFRWINQAAQVKADLEYYRIGAKSLDDIASTFGSTAEDVLKAKKKNIMKAIEIAGNDIDWRELINPYNTNLAIDSKNEAQNEEED